MQGALRTCVKTIRNDLFKHVASDRHVESYKPFFDAHAIAGSEEQEAGPVPQTRDEWKQALLRQGRWIDGSMG